MTTGEKMTDDNKVVVNEDQNVLAILYLLFC